MRNIKSRCGPGYHNLAATGLVVAALAVTSVTHLGATGSSPGRRLSAAARRPARSDGPICRRDPGWARRFAYRYWLAQLLVSPLAPGWRRSRRRQCRQ
jgi:hypothetical protein